MNGYSKLIVTAMAVASFVGGLVWNASTMRSDIGTNRANIEDIEGDQDAIERDIRNMRENIQDIKTQTSIILERVGGRNNE